jgi:hypothetical protein
VARFSWASGGSRALYRVRQFLAGFRGWLEPGEIGEVRTLLAAREIDLFVRMQGRDQKHSFRVLRWLERSAAERHVPLPRELVVAALLHDVGKGHLATWHRVAFVLLNACAPHLAPRLERERGGGWRNALWRLRHHARLGADRLAAAGCSPRVVALVAGPTGAPGADPDLAWLIEADEHC